MSSKGILNNESPFVLFIISRFSQRKSKSDFFLRLDLVNYSLLSNFLLPSTTYKYIHTLQLRYSKLMNKNKCVYVRISLYIRTIVYHSETFATFHVRVEYARRRSGFFRFAIYFDALSVPSR